MKSKNLIVMVLAAVMAAGCGTLRFKDGVLKYIYPIDIAPQVLVLNENHTFIIQSIDGQKWDAGEWRQVRDTLILMSDGFMPSYESLDTLMKEAVNLYLYKGVEPEGSWNPDDLYWQIWLEAVFGWNSNTQANDGYRDIYLIRGKHLYDGVVKTRAGYVRIKPRKR